MELVAVLVRRDDVEEEDVLGRHVQPGHTELHLGEHLPNNQSINGAKQLHTDEVKKIERK